MCVGMIILTHLEYFKTCVDAWIVLLANEVALDVEQLLWVALEERHVGGFGEKDDGFDASVMDEQIA